MVRIIHTNTTPGVPVRQVNYIVQAGGQRYFVACTAMKDDGNKHDAEFEAFVKNITTAGRAEVGQTAAAAA